MRQAVRRSIAGTAALRFRQIGALTPHPRRHSSRRHPCGAQQARDAQDAPAWESRTCEGAVAAQQSWVAAKVGDAQPRTDDIHH